jgi:hypothetical protein
MPRARRDAMPYSLSSPFSSRRETHEKGRMGKRERERERVTDKRSGITSVKKAIVWKHLTVG